MPVVCRSTVLLILSPKSICFDVMAVPLDGMLCFVLVVLITLQSTTCQMYSSQQEDGEAPYPGAGGRYPGPGEGYPGDPRPGGPAGGGYPGGPGGGGMYPPGRPGPGSLRPGSMGPGPGSAPFGHYVGGGEQGPSFEEEGEEGGNPTSNFDPNLENPEWPNMGTGVDGVDWPHPSMGDHIGIASQSISEYGPMDDGTGPSIDEGTMQDSRDHIDDNGATGTDENGSKGGTNSELKPGEQESVKNLPQGIRQNMTMSGEPDDNFNYTGMYVTVALCIAFMVTLVAIALIRGPQGPFKSKRSDEEIAAGVAGLNVGPTGGTVIVLSEGGTSPTDAQWEQKPLREGECDDAVTAVACEGSTTVAVTEIMSKEEGV